MDVLNANGVRTTVAIDATHPNDSAEYVGTGVEVCYDRMFFARAGYKSLFLPDSEQRYTWGLGLRYELASSSAVLIDYSFADYGRLQNVQFVSLSVEF
jgi:hypothetical protein